MGKIQVIRAHVQKLGKCWSDRDGFAMLTGMERPNWVFRQDQGKWLAHPEGNPQWEVQAASFEELRFKVQQLSQDLATSPREVPRVERPEVDQPRLDTPRYVISLDQEKWCGYLQGYPDQSAQGDSFDEVEFKLSLLWRDLVNRKSPTLRKAA
ncbi:MAG: hypothetical protein JSS38_19755 [Nitrospira sp.]|nr:hypothetical protein [Nitrospira sp.]